MSKKQPEPTPQELDAVILSEAERLEALIATEDEVQAADTKASQEDAAARKEILDQICILQVRLRTNDFPEAAEYNVTRQQMRDLQFYKSQLSTLETRWPALFGLPSSTRRLTNGEDLTPAVITALAKLNVT